MTIPHHKEFNPDRHQFKVEGYNKCGGVAPTKNKRVYFKRGRSGSGVIYLYADQLVASRAGTSACAESDLAFGWIGTAIGKGIVLSVKEGWCDYFADNLGPYRKTHAVFVPGVFEERPHGQHLAMLVDANWSLDSIVDLSKCHDGTSMTPSEDADWRAIMDSHAKRWRGQNNALEQLSPETTTSLKETTMTKTNITERAQATGSRILSANKQAAQSAAYLEAGNIANNQLAKVAGKKLPLMLRGYADTPYGKLIIANIAQQLAAEFRPNNKQLQSLTAAMTVAAYSEVIKLVNIDGMIDELLESKDIKAALSKLGDTSED